MLSEAWTGYGYLDFFPFLEKNIYESEISLTILKPPHLPFTLMRRFLVHVVTSVQLQFLFEDRNSFYLPQEIHNARNECPIVSGRQFTYID